jgi:hypothetical protein
MLMGLSLAWTPTDIFICVSLRQSASNRFLFITIIPQLQIESKNLTHCVARHIINIDTSRSSNEAGELSAEAELLGC